MREILFRGKREDNGEWIDGSLLFDPDLGSAQIIGFEYWTSETGIERGAFSEFVNRETVGQFTGVTDKIGKKVFEHDIVRFDGGTFVVVFVDSRMGFCFSGIHGRGCVPGFVMAHWEHLEVIGNIHDNPELMEGKA